MSLAGRQLGFLKRKTWLGMTRRRRSWVSYGKSNSLGKQRLLSLGGVRQTERSSGHQEGRNIHFVGEKDLMGLIRTKDRKEDLTGIAWSLITRCGILGLQE